MAYIETNTLAEHIIAILGSSRNSYAYRRILREQRIARYKKQSVANCLNKLHKKEMIEKSVDGWKLTNKGENISKNENLFEYMDSPFEKGAPRYTIVAFDIANSDTNKRVWLRNQLKIFGYKLIQKSLWQGPGPLSKEFESRLTKLGIRKNVKIFTVVASKAKN